MGGVGSHGIGANQFTVKREYIDRGLPVPAAILDACSASNLAKSGNKRKRVKGIRKRRGQLADNGDDTPSDRVSFEEMQQDIANTIKDIARFEEYEAKQGDNAAYQRKYNKSYQRKARAKEIKEFGATKTALKRSDKRLSKLPEQLICPVCNDAKTCSRQFVILPNKTICRRCWQTCRNRSIDFETLSVEGIRECL